MVHKKKYEKRKKATPVPANDNRKPSKLSCNDLVVYSFEIETRHGFEGFCKRIEKTSDLASFLTFLFEEKFQWHGISKDPAGSWRSVTWRPNWSIALGTLVTDPVRCISNPCNVIRSTNLRHRYLFGVGGTANNRLA